MVGQRFVLGGLADSHFRESQGCRFTHANRPYEDAKGEPFVGRAGQLLTKIIDAMGYTRKDVYIANVLKCRPPGNRDPAPVEIENCQEYLLRQVELIQPKVICTLGNFSTKLLRGDPTGITRLHGRPEVRVIGTRAVRLYPIHHPAAALYTRSLQDTLREDFARLPALLAEPAPPQPEPEPEPIPEPEPDPEPEPEPELQPTVQQLGLF